MPHGHERLGQTGEALDVYLRVGEQIGHLGAPHEIYLGDLFNGFTPAPWLPVGDPPSACYRNASREREKLEPRKKPMWFDRKIAVGSLNRVLGSEPMDDFAKLQASLPAPDVFEQGVGEHEIERAIETREGACIGPEYLDVVCGSECLHVDDDQTGWLEGYCLPEFSRASQIDH